MKKFAYGFIAFVISIFILGGVTLQAQTPTPIKTWGFESSLENWAAGNEKSSIELSTEKAASGTQSVKLVKPATGLEINLQNDVYKDIKQGDVISVKVWLSAADQAKVNGFQIFWQTGSGWTWNSKWFNGSTLIGDSWTTLEHTFPAIATPLQRIGFQLLLKTGNEAATPTLYVDEITISRVAEPTLVDKWGFIGNKGATRTGGWQFKPGAKAGDAGVGGDTTINKTWAAIRGEFPEPVTATESKAVIVTGKLEIKGADLDMWCPIRWGLFRHDSSGVLADSAGVMTRRHPENTYWTGKEADAYGYMFAPNSGAAELTSWAVGGSGTQGVVRGGAWISSYGASHISLGVVRQKPVRAVMIQGVYKFAISVQLVGAKNELRWYLIKEGTPVKYWFGGTVMDTTKITTTFNGVCFALGGDEANKHEPTKAVRGMYLTDVKVDMGAPITIPEAPWEPFYVDRWGFIGNKGPTRTGGWQFKPGDVIGNAGVGGDTTITKQWAAIRGEFPEPVTATESKAIIITGKLEIKGADLDIWGPIRFGLFRADSAGVLVDSAGVMTRRHPENTYWTGKEANHWGYMFTPNSGIADISSFANGNGTQGVTRGGTWMSSWGGALSLGVVRQKPVRAVMIQGVYKFAISVQPVGTANELRWYLIKEGTPVKYWFGGTVMDTTKITTTFNCINFALDGEHCYDKVPTVPVRGMYLEDVKVDLGAPITIPEAPWEAVYVDRWGFIGNKGPTRTGGWQFKPGDVIGNAGVGGDTTINKTWAAIRGEFPEPVTATESKAVIVTGKLEIKGADLDMWCPIRWGLFRHDSARVLADSAGVMTRRHPENTYWTGKEADAYGYMFAPNSGAAELTSWAVGGSGTQGVTRGGAWISSFGASHISLGVVTQKPVRAVMIQGVYKFAISVQPVGAKNELRWYLIKEGTPVKYWFGGTVMDTTKITTTFNGVCFALGGDEANKHEATKAVRGMYLTDVKLDLGAPITVPEAPWEAYYVDQWGFIGGRIGGWKFTPGDVIGNATISGVVPPTSWSAIRGGFIEPIKPATGKALVITGKLEFVGGGFEAWSSLRFGVFYSDSAGKVIATPVDSTHWSGTENHHYGYLFLPQSGSNGPVNWQGIGQTGTFGAIVDRPWISTNGPNDYVLGSNLPKPPNAVGGAGIYSFAISVQSKGVGTNEVRFKLIKSDNTYSFAGIATDNHVPLTTDKFNCVAFALNTNASTTAMKLTDVKIDLGAPVELPTGVEQVAGAIIPTEYALNQNYPNPFNPTTTIEFALPQSSEVNLVVYDLSGRVIAELAKGKFEAGYHKVNFDATNLASGVYFVRLKANNFVKVNKAMLVK